MIRPIIQFPNELLTTVCEPVEHFDDELHLLVDDLFHTMHRNNGVGLAAPQVGVLQRVFVMDVADEGKRPRPKAFINPEILTQWGINQDEEGCLSMPGVFLQVRRAWSVTVGWQGLDGEHFAKKFSGLEARVIQHEIDHLSGILFSERAFPEKMAARQ